MRKNLETVNKNNENHSNVHNILNLSGMTQWKERNSKNLFNFGFYAGRMSFLLMPLATLYEEKIDRQKLTEQKHPERLHYY